MRWGGKLLDGNCNPNNATALNDPGSTVGEIINIAKELVNNTISRLSFGAFNCTAINPQVSYLRIPVLKKTRWRYTCEKATYV